MRKTTEERESLQLIGDLAKLMSDWKKSRNTVTKIIK